MPDRKKNHKKENNTLSENASPVCYIHSPELRPEFEEEVNETLNTQVHTKTSTNPTGIRAETTNKEK
jgi:hypothetical protein